MKAKKTIEVAVNRCYGGFSLSHAAVLEYAKRKGIEIHAFVNYRDADGNLDLDKMVPCHPEGDEFIIYYSTLPLGDDGKIPDKSYFSCREIERDDPDLIAVIKSLGDKSSGRFAELEVVKIPTGVKWHIEEYDGLERVAEDHQTW